MVSVFRRPLVVIVSLCAFCLVPGRARGQTAAAPAEDDPVLQALLAEAMTRSPDLHAAQSAIAAARTSTERARALPDPMVSITYTNDGWAPTLGSMRELSRKYSLSPAKVMHYFSMLLTHRENGQGHGAAVLEREVEAHEKQGGSVPGFSWYLPRLRNYFSGMLVANDTPEEVRAWIRSAPACVKEDEHG